MVDAGPWAPSFLTAALGIDFFHAVVGAQFESFPPRSSTLQRTPGDQVARLPKLERLYSDFVVDDTGLRHLGQLKRLQSLTLNSAREVSDSGAAHLSGLRRLKELVIIRSRITDVSLEVFGKMHELESLQLPFHQFNDDGVSHLRQLKRLRELGLTADNKRPSGVTDDGLEFLLELNGFWRLYAQYTGVTDEFERKLKAKFPKCEVYQ